jgi:hypothetical protein
MSQPSLLLDEHVPRVFEHLLRDRGYEIKQAKDEFGEETTDEELIEWCGANDALLLSNNAKDFETLHRQFDHAGLLLYYDQSIPDNDPEGFARAVEEVIDQYGLSELSNSILTSSPR